MAIKHRPKAVEHFADGLMKLGLVGVSLLKRVKNIANERMLGGCCRHSM